MLFIGKGATELKFRKVNCIQNKIRKNISCFTALDKIFTQCNSTTIYLACITLIYKLGSFRNFKDTR